MLPPTCRLWLVVPAGQRDTRGWPARTLETKMKGRRSLVTMKVLPLVSQGAQSLLTRGGDGKRQIKTTRSRWMGPTRVYAERIARIRMKEWRVSVSLSFALSLSYGFVPLNWIAYKCGRWRMSPNCRATPDSLSRASSVSPRRLSVSLCSCRSKRTSVSDARGKARKLRPPAPRAHVFVVGLGLWDGKDWKEKIKRTKELKTLGNARMIGWHDKKDLESELLRELRLNDFLLRLVSRFVSRQ